MTPVLAEGLHMVACSYSLLGLSIFAKARVRSGSGNCLGTRLRYPEVSVSRSEPDTAPPYHRHALRRLKRQLAAGGRVFPSLKPRRPSVTAAFEPDTTRVTATIMPGRSKENGHTRRVYGIESAQQTKQISAAYQADNLRMATSANPALQSTSIQAFRNR